MNVLGTGISHPFKPIRFGSRVGSKPQPGSVQFSGNVFNKFKWPESSLPAEEGEDFFSPDRVSKYIRFLKETSYDTTKWIRHAKNGDGDIRIDPRIKEQNGLSMYFVFKADGSVYNVVKHHSVQVVKLLPPGSIKPEDLK